jgi:DnaJ-class molecular chaperone
MSTCARCDGSGTIECPTCGGNGRTGGFPIIDVGSFECSRCNGDRQVTCPTCHGSGEVDD